MIRTEPVVVSPLSSVTVRCAVYAPARAYACWASAPSVPLGLPLSPKSQWYEAAAWPSGSFTVLLRATVSGGAPASGVAVTFTLAPACFSTPGPLKCSQSTANRSGLSALHCGLVKTAYSGNVPS